MKPRNAVPILLSVLVSSSHVTEAFRSTSELQHPITVPSKVEVDSHNLSSIISASPLLSFHRDLCSIESVSNNELAVAEFLVDYLESHNFTVTTQKVPQPPDSDLKKERWNVFAVPDPSKFPSSSKSQHGHPNPKILLTSHIDTVPPFIPYSLSYHSSTTQSASSAFNKSAILIRGRGTVDAKACVASMTHAILHSLPHLPTPDTCALLFVVGEESLGSGMRHFSTSPLNHVLNYTTAIFGEPTESKLATGHKGIIGLTLRATGKAAHSGYPWLGASAASAILPALTVLDRLGTTPEPQGGLPSTAKFGNSTVNIGLLRSGVAANVIPSSAFARVAIRLAGGTASLAESIITKAIKTPQVDPHDALSLEFSQGYGPVDLDGSVPAFEEITVNYGTDVPNLDVSAGRKSGVKRYLFGPGSILVAHGEDEGLTVGELEASVGAYGRLIEFALKD